MTSLAKSRARATAQRRLRPMLVNGTRTMRRPRVTRLSRTRLPLTRRALARDASSAARLLCAINHVLSGAEARSPKPDASEAGSWMLRTRVPPIDDTRRREPSTNGEAVIYALALG